MSRNAENEFYRQKAKNYQMNLSEFEAIQDRLDVLKRYIRYKPEDLASLLTGMIQERHLSVDKVIDRKILYKLRHVPNYRTEKIRLVCAGISMKLSLEEMEDLLKTAGYAFSDSEDVDLVCRFLFEENLLKEYLIPVVFQESGIEMPAQIKDLLKYQG